MKNGLILIALVSFSATANHVTDDLYERNNANKAEFIKSLKSVCSESKQKSSCEAYVMDAADGLFMTGKIESKIDQLKSDYEK